MKCKLCGKKLSKKDAFCFMCGTPVTKKPPKDKKKIFKCILLFFIIIAVGFMTYGGIILGKKIHNENLYDDAKRLLDQGKYDEARETFLKVGDRDVEVDLKECTYREACDYHEKGSLQDSFDLFISIRDYSNSEEMIHNPEFNLIRINYEWRTPGCIVKFGPLEWIVLDTVDGQSLILAKDFLYSINYENEKIDDHYTGFQWPDNKIRQYLNEEFYRDYYTYLEKDLIISKELVTYEYEMGSTHKPYKTFKTTDLVFLLSAEEMEKYKYLDLTAESPWLLRSTTRNQKLNSVSSYQEWSYIDYYTWYYEDTGQTKTIVDVYPNGLEVPWIYHTYSYPSFGVRPAMWVDTQGALELQIKKSK